MHIGTLDKADSSIESETFPLVVDLDGTLTKTDLLHESFLNRSPEG